MDAPKIDCIPVGYGLFRLYGSCYVLMQYKVLEIKEENVLKEFNSYDEVLGFLTRKEIEESKTKKKK